MQLGHRPGVTAGMDFCLAVLAKVAGEKAGMRNQLFCKDDPQPPLYAGSPTTSTPKIAAFLLGNWWAFTSGRVAANMRAAANVT